MWGRGAGALAGPGLSGPKHGLSLLEERRGQGSALGIRAGWLPRLGALAPNETWGILGLSLKERVHGEPCVQAAKHKQKPFIRMTSLEASRVVWADVTRTERPQRRPEGLPQFGRPYSKRGRGCALGPLANGCRLCDLRPLFNLSGPHSGTLVCNTYLTSRSLCFECESDLEAQGIRRPLTVTCGLGAGGRAPTEAEFVLLGTYYVLGGG